MDIVLASSNKGKIREFSSLLSSVSANIIPQSQLGIDAAEETGLSFIENAILKARHASEQSGLPALADDSGLAVDALDGAPGIYSARYSGSDADDQKNIQKLLDALTSVPECERTAQFHCVLAFVRHKSDPTPIVCHGVWNGVINTCVSGTEGFGYDPIFWIPELNCTAAELDRDEKAKISHRGSALRQLLDQFESQPLKDKI